MARKVKTRTIIDDTTDEQDQIPVAAPVEPEEMSDPLDSALEEISGRVGVVANVYKLDADNPRKRAWCMDMRPDEHGGYDTADLMKTLQRKFKGGEFELFARDAGVIVRRVKFAVMPPDEVPQEPKQNDQLAMVLAGMQQQIAALANRPAFDLSKVSQMAMQALPVIQAIKSIVAPGSVPQSSAFDLEKFLEMKMKLEALGMGDHEPSGTAQMLALFKELGSPMLEALKTKQGNGSGAPRPMPHAPLPGMNGQTMPLPTMPVAPRDPASSMMLTLKPYIKQIAQMAQAGTKPEDAAEKINALLPDEMIDPVADAIENGTLLMMLSSLPELSPFTGWLQMVFNVLLESWSDADVNSDELGDENVPESGAADGTEPADQS